MFESIITSKRPNWIFRITLAAFVIAAVVASVSVWRMAHMPLSSYRSPLPPLSASQSELASRLQKHVQYLSHEIGQRNLDHAGSMKTTEEYLRRELTRLGYAVEEQKYSVDSQLVSNLEAQLAGTSPS